MSENYSFKHLNRQNKLAEKLLDFVETDEGRDAMIAYAKKHGDLRVKWNDNPVRRFATVRLVGKSSMYEAVGQTVPEAIRNWATMVQDRFQSVSDTMEYLSDPRKLPKLPTHALCQYYEIHQKQLSNIPIADRISATEFLKAIEKECRSRDKTLKTWGHPNE